MSITASTMRIFEPYPGLFAYYDGRIPGHRLHSSEPNWLDDGAYALGIASYALVDGAHALVYDTHISLAHAQAIRSHLRDIGVTDIRVVLSHWHDDHVAGNEVFADCEIVALQRTADLLADNRRRLETGSPPIAPLVMPGRTFEGRLDLAVGRRRVELHHFEIHSADGNVLWLPDDGILLAGDTVEDTVTFVSEAERTPIHIEELVRLRALPVHRILPNHGAPDRIAAGGYQPSLIDANRRYLRSLLDPAGLEQAESSTLKAFIEAEEAGGAISYFEPYEGVHRENVSAMRNTMASAGQ